MPNVDTFQNPHNLMLTNTNMNHVNNLEIPQQTFTEEQIYTNFADQFNIV